MAEWIGHLLTNAPPWVFISVLILIVIIWTVWAVIDATSYGTTSWLFKSRREYLGEKKHDKK